jgi:hypothetical protein
MIVVEVGVKTECKIYGCLSTQKNHQNDVLSWVQNNSIFLKLIVEQLNISGFNR